MSFPQEVKAVYKAFITGSGGGFSAHTYDTFPDNDDITMTVHGTADTYGDYTEIISTVGSAAVWVVGLYITNPTVATDYKVDLGTGLSGSEIRRLTVPFTRTDKTSPSNDLATIQTIGVHVSIPFPIKIPSGTRLAGREKAGATAGAVDVVEMHAAAVAP